MRDAAATWLPIVISIVALLFSWWVTMRQHSLAGELHQMTGVANELSNASNQLPAVIDLMWNTRKVSFLRTEEALWRELPEHPQDLALSDLPDRLRDDLEEICMFYQSVSYLVALNVIDERLALLPLNIRTSRTWNAARNFILNERTKRGPDSVYLRAFESFAARYDEVDVVGLATQLFGPTAVPGQRRAPEPAPSPQPIR